MYCFVISNHQKVQQNITYKELLLDKSITVNETNNVNAVTENRNLTAKTGNGNKHEQSTKKIQNKKKIKKQTKNIKKRKISCHIR